MDTEPSETDEENPQHHKDPTVQLKGKKRQQGTKDLTAQKTIRQMKLVRVIHKIRSYKCISTNINHLLVIKQ